ncbi:hypothetical protein [Nodosilinea sp. P-1105]|uniref:hypothetical protein n=1 Tax=Nodosilinea sp. P-1105 TaxID=2546229 RepID=UPI00146B6606|nr:hypothetical protein [Nodosilinea sp. P-1105]NMF85964.1 hypothetical protein [Nodosilinea sp. P-1105]
MTAAMEFASLDDLQTFLCRWLEDHGHNVYRQVPDPEGGKIDILTQDYAIECQDRLTQTALWATADTIQQTMGHFPDQRWVIAGLTPDSSQEESYQVAEQVKATGIEVWFVDQISPFIDYYDRLAVNVVETVHPPRVNRRNPLAGVAIALGMAAILSFSFWVAYRILDRHQFQVTTENQESQAWEQLHAAVEVWDTNTALSSLEQLAQSRNPCTASFANRFQTALNQRGQEGFRDINPIKRALNQQEGCRLDMRDYEFSQ